MYLISEISSYLETVCTLLSDHCFPTTLCFDHFYYAFELLALVLEALQEPSKFLES